MELIANLIADEFGCYPKTNCRRVVWMNRCGWGYCLPARCHDNVDLRKCLDKLFD